MNSGVSSFPILREKVPHQSRVRSSFFAARSGLPARFGVLLTLLERPRTFRSSDRPRLTRLPHSVDTLPVAWNTGETWDESPRTLDPDLIPYGSSGRGINLRHRESVYSSGPKEYKFIWSLLYDGPPPSVFYYGTLCETFLGSRHWFSQCSKTRNATFKTSLSSFGHEDKRPNGKWFTSKLPDLIRNHYTPGPTDTLYVPFTSPLYTSWRVKILSVPFDTISSLTPEPLRICTSGYLVLRLRCLSRCVSTGLLKTVSTFPSRYLFPISGSVYSNFVGL